MNRSNLATYLNDHLAGSVVAIELLEHLERHYGGSSLVTFLAEIRQEILEDRAELEDIIQRLGLAKSSLRKAMAWMSEKFAVLKLSLDDKAGGHLHLLEAVEAVALGIDGKRALWNALTSAGIPDISHAEMERLIERAKQQREKMEVLRLQAAKDALARDA